MLQLGNENGTVQTATFFHYQINISKTNYENKLHVFVKFWRLAILLIVQLLYLQIRK